MANPSGFKEKNAIDLGAVYTNIDLESLLTDKIVINELNFNSTDIFYELQNQQDNIRKLMDNVKRNSATASVSSGSSDGSSQESAKDFVIKNLRIQNSRLVLAAQLFDLSEDQTIKVNDIHLTNVTKSNYKATIKQLSNQIINQVTKALIEGQADKYINKYSDKLKGKINEKINDKIGNEIGDKIGGQLKNLF